MTAPLALHASAALGGMADGRLQQKSKDLDDDEEIMTKVFYCGCQFVMLIERTTEYRRTTFFITIRDDTGAFA